MAEGWASGTADDVLDGLCNNTAFQIAAFWIQLHTAAPGAAGTSNVAGNATRKQVSFGAASGGAIANDAAITWTSGEVDTAEDYTHWSAWTASVTGTFLCSGTLTANAVTTGDQFEIAVGDLDVTLTVAS